VTVYPAGSDGNVRPARVIHGPLTGMTSPAYLAVDSSGKVYVSNLGNDSVTVYGPKAHGDVRPLQRIKGLDTQLNVQEIAVGQSDNIYVTNITGTVTVYAAGANGDSPPIQTIAGPNTGLDGPRGIAVDAGSNIYVANYVGDSVTVFAAGANGNVAPIQTISGSSTGLRNPNAVALDSDRRIYVVNSLASVTVYAAGANGNVAPIQTIKGKKTRLHYPDAIAVR